MERLVQSDGSERRWPECRARIHDKSPSQTSQTITTKVNSHSGEQLVSKVLGPCLTKVLRECLCRDEERRVRVCERYRCHDGDEHVFLRGEFAGIECEGLAEYGESSSWEDAFK